MEDQYLDLLCEILDFGVHKGDRTGTGTQALFGRQIRCDLADGFPLLTTKKVFFRGVVAELLWMLSGDTNVKTLQDQKVHIWDEWAREDGELGPVYGAQWRDFGGVDQLAELVSSLKKNPDSRRHVVSAWNPSELDMMALPPCHCFFQCFTEEMSDAELTRQYLGNRKGETQEGLQEFIASPREMTLKAGLPTRKLSLQLYQRSADVFLGVPFNIASYALLTHMLAHVCGFAVGEYIHTFGDVHIYSNHRDQVYTQLGREPAPPPRLWLNPEVTDLFSFTPGDVAVVGYEPQPAIPAPVAV